MTAIILPRGDVFGQGGTWTPKSPIPTPRGDLAAGGGKRHPLRRGGAGGADVLSTVEAYDPATNTWTTKAPVPTLRAGLTARVVNGILYAVGGGARYRLLTTVEAFDPVTNTWTPKPPIPTPRMATEAANRMVVGTLNSVRAKRILRIAYYDLGTCKLMATWLMRM